MGFLRKSVKVGPLRFNLSKSGVSISTGMTGLRFGVGPRGNWIRMGSGGLSYRAALSPAAPAKFKSSPVPRPFSYLKLFNFIVFMEKMEAL